MNKHDPSLETDTRDKIAIAFDFDQEGRLDCSVYAPHGLDRVRLISILEQAKLAIYFEGCGG